METFILLTAGQADHVRGPSISTPAAALNPIERQDGIFLLSSDVLVDPAHETHRDFLRVLPLLGGADPSFPGTTAGGGA
jgi:hypothetical protein